MTLRTSRPRTDRTGVPTSRAGRRAGARLLTLLAAALASTVVAFGQAQAESDETSSERPLTADDFAVGRPLEGKPDRLIQTVLIDYDVYRESVEPRLADLRVFDAMGRPVPYAIRRKLGHRDDQERILTLPLFALDGPARSLGRKGESPDEIVAKDDYRIEAELGPEGAIVRVERGAAGRAEAAGAWLLDASGLRDPIVELDLSIDDGGEDHLTRLRVEASSDLVRWRTLESDAVLVRLSQQGHRIERTSFELPSTRARYLRLSPSGGDTTISIEGAKARVRAGGEPPPRLRQTIEGVPDPERSGVILYDLRGLPPVDRVRVRLPDPGTLVEARLESAASAEGPWRRQWSGVLYAFDRGGPIRNPSIRWHGRGDRLIRLVVSKKGGGLMGARPTIEIEWPAEQLLYVDRGDGASTLAVGRLDTPNGSFSSGHLLGLGGLSASRLPTATATLGAPKVLAGEAATVRVEPVPWATYGLWALLVVSVAMILGMSLKLLRAQ